ncbi:growth arrest and DNA damage-inducible proteins-interacting protein 1 [Leptopilina heterotoma]|uniref:growth arrest and DNA damage-inducible proteins-interacting protein 1 n=1 Tax=Leptopilina heterotoma TaxID=63436 RepID=UPI001CAA18F8|nr:growth arrest and DNA damage-inducible proteins-interacting protein 1 [Leptopilina heterotoma]
MNIKVIISRNFGSKFGLSNIFSVRSCSTLEKLVKLKQQTKSGELEYDVVPIFQKEVESEEKLMKLRNKSRLSLSDQNRLHGRKPYNKSIEKFHDSVRYKRRMLGRYGLKALDATPGVAWPTLEDVEDAKAYEAVYNPLSLEENWKLIEEKKREEEERIRLREEEIDEKLKNMQKWKTELQNKINQKEAAENAARIKKEKMMEEIRQEFGFHLDPRTAKFKELMAKKQEDERKKKKSLKKEEKAARALRSMSEQFKIMEDSTKTVETKTENNTVSKDEKLTEKNKV